MLVFSLNSMEVYLGDKFVSLRIEKLRQEQEFEESIHH
jgi:hypothetical protein